MLRFFTFIRRPARPDVGRRFYRLFLLSAVLLMPVLLLARTPQVLQSQQNPAASTADKKPQSESVQPIDESAPLPPAAERQSGPLRLLFAGDTHFLWGVRDQQNRRGMLSPVKKIRPLFLGADYRVINLETVVAHEGKSVNHKTYIFRSDPQNLSVLKFLEVQGLFLANNHTFDLGLPGIEQTLTHVAAAGLSYSGIGKNEAEAIRPFISEVQGLRIAFFSISTVGRRDTFAAATRPGTAQPSPAFFAELQRARSKAEFIVVGVHWGNEYELFPNKEQRDLARKLVRDGADAVIGHHPHVPQGTEFINGRPVVYSLGNFLFGSANYQQTHNLIAVLRIDRKTKRTIAVELHPITGRYRSDGYVIDIPSEEERTGFWEEVYLLCQKLNPGQNIVFEDGLRRMVIMP